MSAHWIVNDRERRGAKDKITRRVLAAIEASDGALRKESTAVEILPPLAAKY